MEEEKRRRAEEEGEEEERKEGVSQGGSLGAPYGQADLREQWEKTAL